jgi:organic hydroperoxide reductase OsmC/OhrA
MHSDHGNESRVTVQREENFRFRVRFNHGRVPDLFTDEPPPLGGGEGAGPKELLASAIGVCISSSLLFCMQKAHLEVRDLEAEVSVETGRNAEGRLRIQRVDVRVSPTVTPEVRERMGRCLELFESFCTVAESVRAGFPVEVELAPHEVAPGPRLEETT